MCEVNLFVEAVGQLANGAVSRLLTAVGDPGQHLFWLTAPDCEAIYIQDCPCSFSDQSGHLLVWRIHLKSSLQ